ncbi:ribosome small subunit-dependent GTPase A [Mycoplasmopsis iners]|uniref:ribosome small subunit-dependent GTPase A n=1 Tax=Mycoplasmopsis iners TaxID=76630 RepID=UPI000495D18D|nr:ribosome small subunit-dependent GTPase A [Mycoplasmopsis iners]
MRGRIYSVTGGKYSIKDENNQMHFLPAAGSFRHAGVVPLVGDYVEFEPDQYINYIYERTNSFVRPRVANIDHIIVVMSVLQPSFQTYLVDKYLALIESKNIEPIIFISKNDLGKCAEYEQYVNLGYKIYEINYKKDEWVKIVQHIFNENTCSLMGQSGVGKTTIINKMLNLNLETQEISKHADRGKHTTRTVQIYDVFGGHLIDTPGFSSLDIKMTKLELARSFKQFRELGQKCKFKSCLHENEPENYCNIKLNVGKLIPEFRYQNYLKLLKEVK